MALSFIKRVFTFGDKPVEDQAAHPAPDRAADVAAVQAELEPKSRDEDLPLAADPVAAVEIETAGGPSGDVVEAVEEEPAAILPGVEETSDLGVVPLSLLEAEAAAETARVEGADLPPSALPGISPARGEIGKHQPRSPLSPSIPRSTRAKNSPTSTPSPCTPRASSMPATQSSWKAATAAR